MPNEIAKDLSEAVAEVQKAQDELIKAQSPDSDCGSAISQDEIDIIVEKIKTAMSKLKAIEHRISNQNALEKTNLMTIVKDSVKNGNKETLNEFFCLNCEVFHCAKKKAYNDL